MFQTTYSDDCFVNTWTPSYFDQWVSFNNKLYYEEILIRIKDYPSWHLVVQSNNKTRTDLRLFCCFGSNHLEGFLELDVPCSKNNWTITVKEFIYLANLHVESLPLYKPESSFANTFLNFAKNIAFFMFLKFWYSYFQNVLCYESHFVYQFISKPFSGVS